MGEQSALFPTYARYPVTFTKGEGSKLWDEEGKQYIDFMSGIAVAALGHAHPQVKEKLIEQLDQLWHTSNLYPIPTQEALAQFLTKHSCADAVFFCNSGAEANEAAIKLARRYQQLVKKTNKYEIISFQQSFHGRTLATLTATGQEKVKEGFHPLPEGFRFSPYNDVEALRAAVTEQTGAIMLELIQGEGGVIQADPAFIQTVTELCEEHDLLLIVDEIQTGLGRTGKLFAYEHFGIEPDIFTLAKGLGNGFPIGAMLGKQKLVEAFGAGSHGSTFGGNPLATTAGLATLQVIVEENLSAHAAQLGEDMLEQLQTKLADCSFVEEIRGLGLILGIKCTGPATELIGRAREAGLLVIPAGPQVIRLLPPLILTQEECEQGIDILCQVIRQYAEEETKE